ncbi:hypothetical protein CO2235_150153 [Cupriavidus oxalaticus]|uniref:Uncharacterized protein n=1 Tax=Cupriavidus oxalaticus TaxID=96344 RepID=A0A375G346_9BURK|nr:hypothetical protein CO2235_150153 [Cupriavidus oxalaticus]
MSPAVLIITACVSIARQMQMTCIRCGSEGDAASCVLVNSCTRDHQPECTIKTKTCTFRGYTNDLEMTFKCACRQTVPFVRTLDLHIRRNHLYFSNMPLLTAPTGVIFFGKPPPGSETEEEHEKPARPHLHALRRTGGLAHAGYDALRVY